MTSKKKKVVYLSAPISGFDIDERRATFERVENELRNLATRFLAQ